jgi:hypothetical protein
MHHALIGRPYYVLVLVFCFSRHEIEIKSLSICLSVIIVAFLWDSHSLPDLWLARKIILYWVGVFSVTRSPYNWNIFNFFSCGRFAKEHRCLVTCNKTIFLRTAFRPVVCRSKLEPRMIISIARAFTSLIQDHLVLRDWRSPPPRQPLFPLRSPVQVSKCFLLLSKRSCVKKYIEAVFFVVQKKRNGCFFLTT